MVRLVGVYSGTVNLQSLQLHSTRVNEMHCDGGSGVALQREVYFGRFHLLDHLHDVLATQCLLDLLHARSCQYSAGLVRVRTHQCEPLLLSVGRNRRAPHFGGKGVGESDAEDLHRDCRLGLELDSNLAVDRERVGRELTQRGQRRGERRRPRNVPGSRPGHRAGTRPARRRFHSPRCRASLCASR